MNALVARYDENKPFIAVPEKVSVPKVNVVAAGFDVHLSGRMLTVNAAGARNGVTVTVLGLDGSKVASAALNAGRATLDLESVKSGAYLVKVDGFGARKVFVR